MVEVLSVLWLGKSSGGLCGLSEVVGASFPSMRYVQGFEEALAGFEQQLPQIVVIEESYLPIELYGFLKRAQESSSLTHFICLCGQESGAALTLGLEAQGIKRVWVVAPEEVVLRKTIVDITKHAFSPARHFDEQRKLIQRLTHGSNNSQDILLMIALDDFDQYSTLFSWLFVHALTREIADFLDRIKPKGSRLFHISDHKYAIVIQDGSLGRAEGFILSLDTLLLDCKIELNGCTIGMGFIAGAAQGSGEILLAKAHAALERSREIGRKYFILEEDDARFRFFQSESLRWMQGVREALAEDRIVPYYQPIVNNTTGQAEKYECLARLIEHGSVVPPNIFLQSARQVGLLGNITFSIIDKSLFLLRGSSLELSINIAERDIWESRIIDYLMERCDYYDINPSRIMIEILEDIGNKKENAHLIEHMHQLHKEGFKIAIDDFGFENSNFGRLIDMGIDYIKIDGGFIKNVEIEERSYKIVDSIVKFCQSIGAKSIAKHVHSVAIQEKVLALGIDYSQGHLFGKASPTPLGISKEARGTSEEA